MAPIIDGDPNKKAPYTRAQYGMTFGGPLDKKNKSYFFFSFEQRRRQEGDGAFARDVEAVLLFQPHEGLAERIVLHHIGDVRADLLRQLEIVEADLQPAPRTGPRNRLGPPRRPSGTGPTSACGALPSEP